MDTIIVVLYLFAVLLVGLWSGRGVRDLRTYAVAGRSYTAWVVFATLSASFIGGGFSMGNAEKVFRFGIANIIALWGFSLQQLVVASFIAPRIGRYPQAISVGDIMAHHYGRVAQVFTGIFAFVLCAGILGAQVGAMGYIFHVLLGLPKIWGILIGVGIVITYDTLGGMKSVVATDILQFVLLGIGLPLTLVLGIAHAGGVHQFIMSVPRGHLVLPGDGFTWGALCSLFLTFVFGETLVPPYVQRLLLGRSVRSTIQGNLWSGLFSIPFFAVTGAIGLTALVIRPAIDPNLAMPEIIQQVLPVGIRGLVIAAMIAVVMSSADSFLNAATVSAVNDVLRPLRLWPPDDRRDLAIAKLINLLLGALAIVFAVSITSVIDILIYSYNFWAPMILVPLASALLGVNAGPRHFMAGACGGALGVLIWNIAMNSPFRIDGLIVGVLANLVLFYAALLLLRPAEPEVSTAR